MLFQGKHSGLQLGQSCPGELLSCLRQQTIEPLLGKAGGVLAARPSRPEGDLKQETFPLPLLLLARKAERRAERAKHRRPLQKLE